MLAMNIAANTAYQQLGKYMVGIWLIDKSITDLGKAARNIRMENWETIYVYYNDKWQDPVHQGAHRARTTAEWRDLVAKAAQASHGDRDTFQHLLEAQVDAYARRFFNMFYLILEQPLVTPMTDADGHIIAPSEGQIVEALNKANRRFKIYDEAWDRQRADDFDTTDSDDSSADFAPSARKIAYNDQYMVYDFKPGRNTFIDAMTGDVRFIDPRVDINDPGAGFSVSKFGKRKIDDSPMVYASHGNIDEDFF